MREPSELLHDGEQLQFGLDWQLEPWEGWSPRALTRASKLLFLRPEPPRHEVYVDPEQLEFWPIDRAAKREGLPTKGGGAPLLVDVGHGSRNRARRTLTGGV